MTMCDLVIIGAGPAGMSAALSAKNDGLDFKLLESEEEGWFPRVSVDSHYVVDNYLGFTKISGSDLIAKFKLHLSDNGIKVNKTNVSRVTKDEDYFKIFCDENNLNTKSLILATGTKQRELEVPGINNYLGKSIFYYCVPDGGRFVGKKVFVVGGRNTGAVTAIYLKKLGCDVEIIEKDLKLNAKPKYNEKIIQERIPSRTGCQVVSVEGEGKLEYIGIKSSKGLEKIAADGLFVCIGLLPNNVLAKQLGININHEGYIAVDNNMSTNISGVYAAGDITGNLKQIIVSAAQGAIAEYNVNKFLNKKT